MLRFGRTPAAGPAVSRGAERRWFVHAAVLPGTAMLVWSGAIHLQLWTDGYRSVPTIGWLFLFQAVTAFVLGAAVVVTRHPLAAAIGALFLVSTAIGLVWSAEWGLFGFQDSFGAPFAAESLGVEWGGAVALILAGYLGWRVGRRRVLPRRVR